MRWFRFAFLILLTAILQAGLVDIIALTKLNIKPDFLLILLVFFAIYCHRSDAIITSFAIGLAADIISSMMGPKIISFGLLGTLLALLNRVIAIRKMPYQALVICATALLAGRLSSFLSLLRTGTSLPGTYSVLFATSIYSAVAGPFLFLPCAWWMRIKTHRFSQH